MMTLNFCILSLTFDRLYNDIRHNFDAKEFLKTFSKWICKTKPLIAIGFSGRYDILKRMEML